MFRNTLIVQKNIPNTSFILALIILTGVFVPVNHQANAANFDLDFQRDETVNGVSRLSNDSYIVCEIGRAHV